REDRPAAALRRAFRSHALRGNGRSHAGRRRRRGFRPQRAVGGAGDLGEIDRRRRSRSPGGNVALRTYRELPLPLGEGRGEGVLMSRFSLTLTLSQRERGFFSARRPVFG